MEKLIGAPTLDAALEALRKLVRQNESRGEKNLIFCEDKLTLLCERGVLAGVGGSFRTEVTTFARYLSGPGVLSKQGSVMLISTIIEENRDRLRCFYERSAPAVYETIAQLNASRVDAEMLQASAEESEGLLKSKLTDLSFLLKSYREKLAERNLLDESDYLSLLPEKISSSDLSDTNVFFFGFSSFTKQAQQGIWAALFKAKSVTGIFTAGCEEFFTNESAKIFHKICVEAGREVETIAGCDDRNEEALHLARGLFSSERATLPQRKTDKVFRYRAVDEEAELSVTAALIKKYVSEGLRYRDFAVLVPDKKSFLLAEKVFQAHKIPFFADKKRAFSEHPFCKFVLACLTAASSGVLPDEADEIASSVYFGDGGGYRNYLLKYGGYRGAVKREIKDGEAVKEFDREALVACREKMLAILKLFPAKAKGCEYVAAVRSLGELVRKDEITQALQEHFTGAEKQFLELAPLERVLDEMEFLGGEKKFSARDFSLELKSGLSALEISMIPQFFDAVFVGDVTESKFERVQVLFAVGLTGDLPRAAADTALITDGEMQKLEKLKVEIEPKIEQVNARARESITLNLCAFSKALYLSYPLEKGGEETEKSEIFSDAEKFFSMPPMPELFPFDCTEEQPALLKLLSVRHEVESGQQIKDPKFDALYEALKEEYGEAFLEQLFSGGEKQPVPMKGELQVSPTELEKYFECPYASFVNRMLRLQERKERVLLDTDTGNFVHSVLEKSAEKFNEFKTEAECRSFARALAEELLKTPRFAALSDTLEGVYTSSRLLHECEEVTVAAWKQVCYSDFRVLKIEEKISIPELSLSGTPDRIDGVDSFVRVIDYKTGKIDDSPSAYYTGRKLQLQLYLKGVSREQLAAGAFYFPASEQFYKDGEEKFRMSGFYCNDEDVMFSMDPALKQGGESKLFEGRIGGRALDKAMSREKFDDFLDYGIMLSSRAEKEMQEGNLTPNPYDGTCKYCKFKSLCGFIGTPRKEKKISCTEIANIVRRERGEK